MTDIDRFASEDFIQQSPRIMILSGEGTGVGTREEYTGKRTQRALKTRLTKERCNGDRWARAEIQCPETETWYDADTMDWLGD